MSKLEKKAYEANIKAADLIANDLKEFVKMRNAFALKKVFLTILNTNLLKIMKST